MIDFRRIVNHTHPLCTHTFHCPQACFYRGARCSFSVFVVSRGSERASYSSKCGLSIQPLHCILHRNLSCIHLMPAAQLQLSTAPPAPTNLPTIPALLTYLAQLLLNQSSYTVVLMGTRISTNGHCTLRCLVTRR